MAAPAAAAGLSPRMRHILATDPLAQRIAQLSACSSSTPTVLHMREDMCALRYSLGPDAGRLAVVLKLTLQERASFERRQMQNEVCAAVALPIAALLRPLLAWRRDQAGNMLAVSLDAGATAEALLERAAGAGDHQGGWLGLPLRERVELARWLLAGVLLALQDMAPMCHHDIKPANIAVRPPAHPADQGPLVALIDFGAAVHVAALRSPGRCTCYPVVSLEHFDAALLQRCSGNGSGGSGSGIGNGAPPAGCQGGVAAAGASAAGPAPHTPPAYLLDSDQGRLEALSVGTDLFCAGLAAAKLLLLGHEPDWLVWESARYEPHGQEQEVEFLASLEGFHGGLEWGTSHDSEVRAVQQALPPDCLSALMRLCAVSPASRPQGLQAAMQLPFVAGAIRTLRQQRGVHDAAYQADRQRLITLLQGVPGVRLASAAAPPAAAPSTANAASSRGLPGGSSGRSSSSSCVAQQAWHAA